MYFGQISLNLNSLVVRVECMQEEIQNDQCVVPTIKHGDGSVMAWGYFRERGTDLIQVMAIM